jgi:hypothetical protein
MHRRPAFDGRYVGLWHPAGFASITFVIGPFV